MASELPESPPLPPSDGLERQVVAEHAAGVFEQNIPGRRVFQFMPGKQDGKRNVQRQSAGIAQLCTAPFARQADEKQERRLELGCAGERKKTKRLAATSSAAIGPRRKAASGLFASCKWQ